ncbi:MAG: polysaccharide biosynthesis C-terminal domain-containing protein [Gemmatimonadota bacterium]
MRNVLRFAVASGVPSLVNFAALSVYSRLLAPGEYGRFALVVAATGLVNGVAFQWIRSGARRYAAAFPNDLPAFRATLARLYAAVLGAVAIGCFAGILVAPEGWKPIVGVGACFLAVQAWAELSLELTLARSDARRYGTLLLSRSVTAALIGGGLAWAGWGAIGVLVGGIAGFLAIGALSLVNEWRGTLWASRKEGMAGHLIRYGAPLAWAFGLQFILDQSDRFLLGMFRGTAEVGRYAVAYDLTQQSLTTLMMIVNLSMVPLIFRVLEQQGATEARAALARQGALLMAVALPAAVALAILAPNVAGVLLGANYRTAADGLIPVVAAAGLVGGLKVYYFDLGFQLGKATRFQLVISAVSAGLNVILNVIWIPRWGAKGAAYATLASLCIGALLSFIGSRAVFSVPIPAQQWFRILVAVAAMSGALLLLRANEGVVALVVQVVVGGLVFVGAAYTLNVAGARKHSAVVGAG